LRDGFGFCDIFEDPLDHDLGLAIRVGGGADGIGFIKRDPFRNAIDRRGRGEDEVMDVIIPHHIEDIEGAAKVILIILNRLIDRLRRPLYSPRNG
jgi:hypothetical protein